MLTPEEIVSIARRVFEDEDVEVVDHQMDSFSKSSVGFIGKHQKLAMKVRRSKKNSDTDLVQLFVKALPEVSESQLKFIHQFGFFKHEALYFNQLLPLLRESFVGEDWCPKCFLANDEVVVLEDMRERGFAMLDGKMFDGEHLRAALRAQARLHAASLLVQPRLGKSPNELYPEACAEQIFNARLQNRMWLYVEFAEQVAQRLGRDHSRISAGLQRGYERLLRAKDRQSKLELVVCHGDCWPNNYLFDRAQPPRAVVIDYQIIRYAPRMYDVAQLVYLSTNVDARRRELRKAIEAYHEELCDTLRRNDPELERPSLEDLLEEYEDLMLSTLLTSVMYYPIIAISPRIMQSKYRGDMELFYRQVMTRVNNEHVLELYEEDEEFAERLNEVVIELVDYCEKHDIPLDEQSRV